MFDTVNGLLLFSLSPNSDLTSKKHFAGAFCAVAHELKVGGALFASRLFPGRTALGFELASKLALFSRPALLAFFVVFFLSCAKQREGRNVL